ncbi:hypothetical protein D3C87_2139920 [compost metagenome]
MILTPTRPRRDGAMLAAPPISEKRMTGTTIILSRRMKMSPKNLVLSTNALIASGLL